MSDFNFDDSFKEMMGYLITMSQSEYEDLKRTVDDIINNNVRNKPLIENTLDRLLNLQMIDEQKAKPLFFRLNDYYKNIDKSASNDYQNYYCQDDDDDLNLILRKKG